MPNFWQSQMHQYKICSKCGCYLGNLLLGTNLRAHGSTHFPQCGRYTPYPSSFMQMHRSSPAFDCKKEYFLNSCLFIDNLSSIFSHLKAKFQECLVMSFHHTFNSVLLFFYAIYVTLEPSRPSTSRQLRSVLFCRI